MEILPFVGLLRSGKSVVGLFRSHNKSSGVRLPSYIRNTGDLRPNK